MSIGLALLASADPATIQQFSRALEQLSISTEVCQESRAAIGVLKWRKFDAAIVDLQLGSGFVFERPVSKESIYR